MKIVTPCVLCRKNIPQGKRKVSIQATGLIGLVCHNCYMALGKSHRLVRLYSHIASLTADNERLRRSISLQIAFHEDLIAADLSDMAADAVTVGMVFQASSRNHIVRLKAALQPKEGE